MATEKLKIGDKAPDFNLIGIDNKYYTINSFNDKKLLCVIFSCNHCPYVKAYEERIIAIQKEFENDLQIVAINSNDEINYPEDSFDEMKKRYREKGYNFPYLRDADQKVAESYDATHTPEVFLFDEERRLQYHGRIDDNWNYPNQVKEHYLRDAIKALIKGEEIKIKETYSIGCTIKWKL